MCRVIRVADLLGAAGEYGSGLYSHENWDGGSSLGLTDLNDSNDEGLLADGMAEELDDQPLSSGQRVAKAIRKVEAIPCVPKAVPLKGGARRAVR